MIDQGNHAIAAIAFSLILLFQSGGTGGGKNQVPAPATAPAPVPASDEISVTGDDLSRLKISALTSRLSATEGDSLEAQVRATTLQLELLKRQLNDSRQRSRELLLAYQKLASEIAKIPLEKLPEYEIRETDKSVVFKRRLKTGN